MQVMPSTARWLADVDPSIERRHAEHIETPGNALRLGAVYLRRMLDRTDGNVALALAAYNAGPGNLNKWRKRYDESDLDEFIERIPFNETRDYVKRVLGNYSAYLTLYPDAAPALTAQAR